jgi:hypothetical protein
MKLIDKYLILLCVFVCCSCNYLDIVPDEKPTEEDAFKLTERYLYSCYSYIPDPRDGSYSLDLMTGDDVVTPWEHETFGKFAQGNYTPSNPYINYWHDLFKGIRQCYLLKENLGSVPGLSDELKAAYDAEADFLIAFYHFFLLRTYGPAVLVKELPDVTSSDSPEALLGRNSYDECVAWVTDQLKNVAGRLPMRRTGIDYGRATGVAAMAIRARLLLYAASPQFNGGEQFKSLYADFKNPDGTQLISTTYDPNKWVIAAQACKEAIDWAREPEANYDLYEANVNSLPNYPEPTDLTQRSLRFTFVDKDNTPEVIWAFCKKESYNYGLQGKSIPRLSTTAYGGLAPTLRQIERFYTKNGLPIDEDPAYDYPNRYEVANFPVEEKDINGEGESLKLNMGREPRFYAWIAFHNGYYEVSGEDDREEFSYAPKWKRGKDKKYKQLVQFMKRQNMGLTNDNKYGTKTGYLNKKGTHPGTSASKSTGFKVIDYPWPMVRLAELYLNYAEACVECNDLTEAKKYLNYVRERAGIPKVEVSWDGIAELTQDKLREIVHQERLIELYLENHNFWDIRRWGIAETLGEQPKGLSVQATTITEFAKPVSVDVQRRFIPAHYLMPLPISEINKNPNMVQNPGYDE